MYIVSNVNLYVIIHNVTIQDPLGHGSVSAGVPCVQHRVLLINVEYIVFGIGNYWYAFGSIQ